jgi:hypothetical protein
MLVVGGALHKDIDIVHVKGNYAFEAVSIVMI